MTITGASLRQERRFETRLAASLRGAEEDSAIALLDLSRSGALAAAARPPAPGARVILSGDGLEVAARVAWVNDRHFGLAFEAPLRATELLVQLSRSRAASGP